MNRCRFERMEEGMNISCYDQKENRWLGYNEFAINSNGWVILLDEESMTFHPITEHEKDRYMIYITKIEGQS